jgi:hypothetical protein
VADYGDAESFGDVGGLCEGLGEEVELNAQNNERRRKGNEGPILFCEMQPSMMFSTESSSSTSIQT